MKRINLLMSGSKHKEERFKMNIFVFPIILFLAAVFCFIILVSILSSDYRERNSHHDSKPGSYYYESHKKERK